VCQSVANNPVHTITAHEFFTFNLLFPTAVSFILFDRHRVEKTQVQKGKCINVMDREVVKKYHIMYDYTEVKHKLSISFLLVSVLFELVRAKRTLPGEWQVRAFCIGTVTIRALCRS
jgi:hypothetical protein